MSTSPNKEEEIKNKPNDLFLAIASHLSPIKPKGKNSAFSPLSLQALVSLIASAASGPTLQQLLSFLKSESVNDVNARYSEIVSSVLADAAGGPKLSFPNAVWIQEGLPLKNSFKQVVDNVYKASSYRVDFVNTPVSEIISEVNSWAEEKTNGLIKEVLKSASVNESTRFILANALYFKGKWLKDYFDTSLTKEGYFHLLGGDSVKVPFMRTYNRDHYIGCFDGFKVLRLPYKHGEYDERRFSMYIILPDAKDGLSTLVEKVVSEPDFIDRHMPEYEVPVYNFLRLPRFKISFEFTAREALEQFGLSLPFQVGGLTEMVEEGQNLKVKEIYHKCFIEVNEEGTEAAAVSVTNDEYEADEDEPTPVIFVADHPFMFLVREDTTGVVLFLGYVLNPLLEE